jgi:hypothetical protein
MSLAGTTNRVRILVPTPTRRAVTYYSEWGASNTIALFESIMSSPTHPDPRRTTAPQARPQIIAPLLPADVTNP